ncbi:MAG TPA: ammonia-forming cytochrome c nitrite reductase subunit c552, partial [Candidatus Wunengus sp. YC64]|uniref:ammonia-forming cytochrome c nitrite reductase subunit c552 n=1 Tax=Candidatus Wunengus sp. YC64 TaxID=3367700 RepID=UPI004025EB27
MSSFLPIHFRGNTKIIYLLTIVVVAAATVGVVLLLENVSQRKEEARQQVFRVVEITEDTIDPVIWGKNFPRQYDGYRRTVDTERTRHGGSEAFEKLDEDPRWREIFKGYAFGVDYREDRGHAYMLSDQDITERIKIVKQPGACLHCHSSVLPAYREAGIKAGVPADEAHRQEQIMKGFEIVCAMPYGEARKMVSHP